jgi:hypothetical protein
VESVRHCEFSTGLWPTSLDETDFMGRSGLVLDFGAVGKRSVSQ